MGYELTPEQTAQAEEKRRERLEKRLWKEKQPDDTGPSLFLARSWIQLQLPDQPHSRSIKVMTWNVRTISLRVPLRSAQIIIAACSVSHSCVRVNVHPKQLPMNHRIGALPN